MKKPLLFLVLALALVGTACSSDKKGQLVSDATSPSPTPSSAGACDWLAQTVVSGAKDAKPAVTIPDCQPPATLLTKDVIPGTGAEAKNGTHVTVQYLGVSWSTKQEFDASWNRGTPFDLDLPGQVITGWNEGIPGMKVGGRRLLIIPPDKGYGPQGSGPIAPNETLVFVVDLLEAK